MVVELPTIKLVNAAESAERMEAKKLEEVALVFRRLVIAPFVLYKFVAVSAVADAVVSTVCPETERDVAEAVVSVV